MEELKLTIHDLSNMCRLCLKRDVTMTDMYSFSSKLGKQIADKIMECTHVKLTELDEMPTRICQTCCNRLEDIHEFQIQVVQSEKTLRHYLQQLHCAEKRTNHLMHGSSEYLKDQTSGTEVTFKCEPVEMNDMDVSYWNEKQSRSPNATNHIKEETSTELEFCHVEIKEEPNNDDKLITDDLYRKCSDDITNTPCNEDKIKVENIGYDEMIPDAKCSDFDGSLNKIGNPCAYDIVNKKPSVIKKPYQCNICKKSFRFLSDLNKHKLSHTDEKPYQCEVCRTCFKQSSDLKMHTLIHTGEKPYQCDVCKKCFTQNISLKNHKLTHTGIKPFSCDVCKRSFRQLPHLNKHKLIHTGEKPYQCDICKMCFRLSDHLKGHKLTHTGEKPYQCEVCEMSFRNLGTFKKHKFTHTGEKPYQCDICEKTFRQLYSLKRHKLIHTGEKP